MADDSDVAAALPHYDIGTELGRGGFGVVRAGRHRHLDREVAIKELPRALASDPKVRARFAIEARVLASFSHPHIVPVYDYVESDGLCLLVMEHLPGGSVWTRFNNDGIGPETACAIVMATCSGLHYAHERGVLHRDVKPENLLYSAANVLKITDFGIAKVVGGSETLATRGGEILGTPQYMAPEQAEGRDLGPPADVYASGLMLYELLCGQLPYVEEGGPLAIVYRHVYEDPTPLQQFAPDLPPELVEVTMRAMARAPEERYQTAEAFGLAIGEAAAAAWGPSWQERSEQQVFELGTTTRPPPSKPAPPESRPGEPSTVVVNPRRSPSAPRSAPPAQPVPPAQPAGVDAGGGRPPSRIGARVRPRREKAAGAAADLDKPDFDRADFVPIRQVIDLPAPPYAHAATAMVLLLVAIAVAFIGIGGQPRTGVLGPDLVTVAGVDPAHATPTLDLTKPVEVRVLGLPPGAAGATAVQLAFSAAGIHLFESSTENLVPGDAGMAASVSAKGGRYLVAGEVTAELRFVAGDQVVLTGELPARSKQSAFLTIPGVIVVALLLFVVAYVESLLRPLRRGGRRLSGIVGMVVMGGLLGAAMVLFVWVVGGPEPAMPTVTICALLGAGAGVAAALAAIRIGRRARIKPRIKQAERERPAA